MGSGELAESPSSLDRTIEETLKEGQPSSIVTGIWLKSSISVRRCSIRYELTYAQLTTHFLWRTAECLELCGLVCAPTLCNRRVGCDGISHRRPSPWSPLPPRRCFLSGTACPGSGMPDGRHRRALQPVLTPMPPRVPAHRTRTSCGPPPFKQKPCRKLKRPLNPHFHDFVLCVVYNIFVKV